MLRQVCQPAGAVFIAAHNVLSESFCTWFCEKIFCQLCPNFRGVGVASASEIRVRLAENQPQRQVQERLREYIFNDFYLNWHACWRRHHHSWKPIAPHLWCSRNRRQHSQSALSRSLLIPACPSDTREFAHASMAHSRLPSGTFIVINSCAAGLLPL